jgi:hypothetical protein
MGLLDQFSAWDAASLETVRAYALSCDRLARLQADSIDDTRGLHREVRTNLALLKARNLEN